MDFILITLALLILISIKLEIKLLVNPIKHNSPAYFLVQCLGEERYIILLKTLAGLFFIIGIIMLVK